MSGSIFLITPSRGGGGAGGTAIGIYWVEARESAKHPTM